MLSQCVPGSPFPREPGAEASSDPEVEEKLSFALLLPDANSLVNIVLPAATLPL